MCTLVCTCTRRGSGRPTFAHSLSLSLSLSLCQTASSARSLKAIASEAKRSKCTTTTPTTPGRTLHRGQKNAGEHAPVARKVLAVTNGQVLTCTASSSTPRLGSAGVKASLRINVQKTKILASFVLTTFLQAQSSHGASKRLIRCLWYKPIRARSPPSVSEHPPQG